MSGCEVIAEYCVTPAVIGRSFIFIFKCIYWLVVVLIEIVYLQIQIY